MWTGDSAARYEKSRQAAQQKLEQDTDNGITAPPADNTIASAQLQTEENMRSQARRTTRKKASSISQSPAGNLKGLRTKIDESLQGRGGGVLGVERRH